MQVWPAGHASDAEEAIAFTELENINCMVETFPLASANEAFGIFPLSQDLVVAANFSVEAMLKGTVRFRAVVIME